MIVPVCVDGAANEWCVVELQGQLIPEGQEDMRDVDIGKLWFENGVPTVRIGNHIVTGKVAPLAKPFAVLQKEELVGDEEAKAGDANESEGDAAEADARTRYQVVGIARSRVIFAQRPKPVLT